MNKYAFSLFIIPFLFSSCSEPEKKKEFKDTTHEVTPKVFIGNWHVYDDEGNEFYIMINPDGKAESNWDTGQEGEWKIVDNRLVIIWTDGWKDVIFLEGKKYQKLGFAPNTPLEGESYGKAHAERVGSISK